MFGAAAVIAAIGAGIAASIWSFNQGVDPEALKQALADMPPVKVETSGTVTMKDGTVTMREGTVSGTVALAPGATVSLAPGATVSIDGEIPVLPPPPPNAPTKTEDGRCHPHQRYGLQERRARRGRDHDRLGLSFRQRQSPRSSVLLLFDRRGAEESRKIDIAFDRVPATIRDGLVPDLRRRIGEMPMVGGDMRRALWSALVTAAMLAVSVGAAGAETIIGRASVVDGDTIEIRGTRIRLEGIDAPESRQTCRDGSGRKYLCGQRAAFALALKIGARNLSCQVIDLDRYGRSLATCRMGEIDINAWMVASGWALAYRKYSEAYVADEAAAQASNAGLWAGAFVPPWDWRRR